MQSLFSPSDRSSAREVHTDLFIEYEASVHHTPTVFTNEMLKAYSGSIKQTSIEELCKNCYHFKLFTA